MRRSDPQHLREPPHRSCQILAFLTVVLFSRLVVVSQAEREACASIIRGCLQDGQRLDEARTLWMTCLSAREIHLF